MCNFCFIFHKEIVTFKHFWNVIAITLYLVQAKEEKRDFMLAADARVGCHYSIKQSVEKKIPWLLSQ